MTIMTTNMVDNKKGFKWDKGKEQIELVRSLRLRYCFVDLLIIFIVYTFIVCS